MCIRDSMKYKYCTRRVLDWVLHGQPMKWLKQMRQIVKTRLYTKRHLVTELGITQNNINHWLKPVARFGSLSKQLSQWRQQGGSHKFAYLMRKTMISARSASTCRACRVWKLFTCVFHFDEFLWLRRWKEFKKLRLQLHRKLSICHHMLTSSTELESR